VVARRIRVRPAVLDHLTGTIGATATLPPARGRSGSRAAVRALARGTGTLHGFHDDKALPADSGTCHEIA
jgi:hypothetical protein